MPKFTQLRSKLAKHAKYSFDFVQKLAKMPKSFNFVQIWLKIANIHSIFVQIWLVCQPFPIGVTVFSISTLFWRVCQQFPIGVTVFSHFYIILACVPTVSHWSDCIFKFLHYFCLYANGIPLE